MIQQDFYSRQRWWIKLLADYDLSILYHLGKANIVMDALSRKVINMGILAYFPIVKWPLTVDIQSLVDRLVRLDISDSGPVLAYIGAQPSLSD